MSWSPSQSVARLARLRGRSFFLDLAAKQVAIVRGLKLPPRRLPGRHA